MKKIHRIAVIVISTLCFSTSLIAAEIEEEKNDGLLTWLSEHFTIGGTLEVEAWWSEDFDGVSENSIDLATSEIDIEAEVVEWLTGSIVFEWDTDEDKFRVDEATVTLGPAGDFPAYFQLGLFDVPFGVYDGNTVTDPLTEEVFKIKENAVVVGMDRSDFSTSFYFFNGDASEGDGNNSFEQFGATIGYKVKKDLYRLDCNLGYVNSVIGSETLSEEYDMEAGYVAGITAQLGLRFAGLVFLAEYLGAVDDYQAPDEDEPSARPGSYHLEAGYNTAIFGVPALLTVAYSRSSDLVNIVPRSRMSAVLWLGLIEGIDLNFEYTQDSDYSRNSGASGEKSDLYTIQLSYEF